MQDGTAGILAIRGLRRSPSPEGVSCRRRCLTRVPREANARRPRRVLRYKQGCPARAEVHGRTISASEAGEVSATVTGVGRLVTPALRKRSQRRRLEDGCLNDECCRLATANNLPVSPSLAATGSQAIQPVYKQPAHAVDKRQLTTYLRVPPSLAATGSQEISPVLRALYPSRGCANGHQPG